MKRKIKHGIPRINNGKKKKKSESKSESKSEIDAIGSNSSDEGGCLDPGFCDAVYYCDYVFKRLLESKSESESESVLDEMDYKTKVAAAAAFPSVVGILCRNLPDDMAVYKLRYSRTSMLLHKSQIEARGGDLVFWGCGIIIECEQDLATSHSYLSTIICPATLFVRTDAVQPPDIKVHVYLWDGKLCKGQVLAWDFHYNLAAVRVQSHSPLPTATLRNLDDFVSILPTDHPRSFHHLLPHSNLFKISPGTKIITLARTLRPYNAHVVGSGVFGTTSSDVKMDCNELYWVQDNNHPERNGGAVINYSGEVIGLMFYNSPFLPINIVLSWWNHFKSCSQYRRPWLGVEIANLHSCCSNFLGEFMRKFPNVAGGVFVTKVADSPAYCSGIRPKDVIVKCDGIEVRSTLEFFDIVWNKVGGEPVELNILRASDAETLKICLAVEETAPDKFYQWKRTFWNVIPRDQ